MSYFPRPRFAALSLEFSNVFCAAADDSANAGLLAVNLKIFECKIEM